MRLGWKILIGLLLPVAGAAQPPPPIHVPAAGQSYVDPTTGNKVWGVTDRKRCPRGGYHYYSYWSVWNAAGTHLLVACGGSPGDGLLLVRDTDLKVVRWDADLDCPMQRHFWSWTDPKKIYGDHGTAILSFNVVDSVGCRVLGDLGKIAVGGRRPSYVRLAYVSFDDRYILVELQRGDWHVFGLVTFDQQTKRVVGTLDTTQLGSYDEAVFTRDNKVWVVTGSQSFRYELDFSSKTRASGHGHHAHGLLPDDTPVVTKPTETSECPPGSIAGLASGWKPTIALIDEATGQTLWHIACHVKGGHSFDHFSWNHSQRDFFFMSTNSYDGFSGPLAFTIARVRLKFDAHGKINGDISESLAHHRSDYPQLGYNASPRATCNMQGTRCLFASSMTVQTDNTDPQPHLYIVDVPAVESASR